MQNLCTENATTYCERKLIEDLKNEKKIFYSWTRRLNIVKMALLPNSIYIFTAIPIKLPGAFLSEIYNLILTLVCKFTDTQNSPNKPEKEQSSRTHTYHFQNLLQCYIKMVG